MPFGYPYRIDDSGRTARADSDSESYVRSLIEQVLFVSPLERVNQPELGSDLRNLVFGPGDDALSTAAQLSVQSALQKWLSDVILVKDVQVETEDSTLRVTVAYQLLGSPQLSVASFTKET